MKVCVTWNRGTPPELDVDFLVTFTDPFNPEIELLEGDLSWGAWSELVSNGAPANIGSLTTTDADNYVVKIANGTGPGAANVGSLVLQPSGDNYSSIAPGSSISGDLTGDLVVQNDTSGEGGEVGFDIGGDAIGNITAPRVFFLGIAGEASGVITIGEVRALPEQGSGVQIQGIVSGTLEIGVLKTSSNLNGGVSGDLLITDRIEGAPGMTLRIRDDVSSTAFIVIADTTGNINVSLASGDFAEFEFAGDLFLPNGIRAGAEINTTAPLSLLPPDRTPISVLKRLLPSPISPTWRCRINIEGFMTSDSEVDLNDQPLAGHLDTPSGGDGVILNGGAVTGSAEFGYQEFIFSGTATFASVSSSGTVGTDGGAAFTGTLQINGAMDGHVLLSGPLASPGEIHVNGNIAGPVDIIVESSEVSDGEIVANADQSGGGSITGAVTINGIFDGNVCGDNLSATAPLPSNFEVETFGPNWTICGQAQCFCNAPSCEPLLTSAVSRTANPSGPSGTCTVAAVLSGDCQSEPHNSRIAEMRFTFDDDASSTCLAFIEQATCAAEDFVPYSGSAVPDCDPGPGANELTCTFSPALENGRTYRFNLSGGSVIIRGLIGDVNSDGFVNATDRSVVVGVWTGSGFTCPTDVSSDGATNATDRSIVVGAWTGTENCAPCPGSGEGAGMAPSGGRGGSGGWTYVQSEAALEIRPVGGGAAVDKLVSGERYEVHYLGLAHPAEAYALLVLATCAAPPLTDVQPADSGDWAGTGMFEFAAFDPSSSEGLQRCGMALDDQGGGASTDSTQAPICTFTAGGPGEFVLQLKLSFVDEAGQTTYESEAGGSFNSIE